MASANMLNILYAKKVSPLDFNWDSLMAPPLLSLLSMEDIYNLNAIAMSNKLASKPKEKYAMIDRILVQRGFKKIASGTNRIAYKYLDNQSIAIKVAIDRVGVKDNPAEYLNQFKLKPFVTKVFEVSPCGTVGLFERVEGITSREEFLHVSDDIYDLLVEKVIGKYVVQDVGSSFFQNYGMRVGFGPVLLDFPYVYELDGNKMYCNRKDPITQQYCLGEIDYDTGFNNLICTKCGKLYLAKQLEKPIENNIIIVEQKGVKQDMEIILTRGNEIVKTFKTEGESSAILSKQQLMDIKVRNLDAFKKNQNKNLEYRKQKYQLQDQQEQTDQETHILEIRNEVKDEPEEQYEPVVEVVAERESIPSGSTMKYEHETVIRLDDATIDDESTDCRTNYNENISVNDYAPVYSVPQKDENIENDNESGDMLLSEEDDELWNNAQVLEELNINTEDEEAAVLEEF